jgi:phosphoribosyl-dephospho-CoA transferase
MVNALTQRIQVHDLLEVDAERLLAAEELHEDRPPEWVLVCLHATPIVHVRRGVESDTALPVGVRGTSRAQRWATVCHGAFIRSVTPPEQLLAFPIPAARAALIPALQSLLQLTTFWADLNFRWGPGGSIGFELLTGREVATAESDLDVVIYAPWRIAKQEAAHLCDLVTDLPGTIDIRVETPRCGFSLREYASVSTQKILLRTPFGEILGDDPWNEAPWSEGQLSPSMNEGMHRAWERP